MRCDAMRSVWSGWSLAVDNQSPEEEMWMRPRLIVPYLSAFFVYNPALCLLWQTHPHNIRQPTTNTFNNYTTRPFDFFEPPDYSFCVSTYIHSATSITTRPSDATYPFAKGTKTKIPANPSALHSGCPNRLSDPQGGLRRAGKL